MKTVMGVIMKSVLGIIVAVLALNAQAEMQEFKVVIKDHHFIPAEVKVPAGVKIKLIVENQDATPEEFESDELHREKIIAGNKTAKIIIGPLKPGSYPFFGEFNEDTAQGTVIAE